MKATVHLAGPPQLGGLYQECARCGHVLQDYTGGEVGVVAEPGASTDIAHWTEGERIATAGNATWLIGPPGRPLDATETECRPTS